MWAEFIVPKDDLERILRHAVPLTIYPEGADDTAHSLEITELMEVALVADVGLRIVCKARLRWPVLGITVPLALKSLTLLLLPTIRHDAATTETKEHDVLGFRFSIERADFTALPAMIDVRVTEIINAKLAEKESELSWDFTTGLTTMAPLPALLEPLASFAIRPAWGKVRITDAAIVYAVSFHSAVIRRGETAPEEFQGKPETTDRA
jgi:hypothetical protein